ncbi:hypothetical protein AGLY_010521 [Aphis glycines]|uniref:Uncharacterized protein n=1 Tax=Aphis glycines TaxID=307491 RepID=A0A6G0TDZ6_APHGL|nr:hypothetical protein AGLY_010521 [Aphis glycines]
MLVGNFFYGYVLTIYSFEFTPKMKTSYFCVLLMSISSEEISELDRTAMSLIYSLVDIVEIPYRQFENVLNPSVAGEKKEPFLKDVLAKLHQKKEEIEKTYLESLSPELREFKKKKLIEYANNSQRIANSIRDTSKAVRLMINTYFNTLPKNVQNKIIDLGKDLNNILHKIKVPIPPTTNDYGFIILFFIIVLFI